MRTHGVQSLLMGGQACVLYGALEFSRDTDLVVLASSDNLDRLRRALDAIGAKAIAVPPFEREYLDRGHAVHFAAGDAGPSRVRIDVMAKMRNVDAFPDLWTRRTTIELDGETIDVVSLPDLVLAKKTQRDKDWPVIRRLVDNHYLTYRTEPTDERIRWWLEELRTPTLLEEAARTYPHAAQSLHEKRPLLRLIDQEAESVLQDTLDREEASEREADRAYWAPLRAELETLRRQRRTGQGT